MKLVLAIWSIIAWALSAVLQMALAIIMLPLSWVVPFERWQGTWPAAIVGRIRYLALASTTVHRHAGFDPDRMCVFVMNHTSMLDGYLAVHALPHPFCGIENAEHLHIPGYGWLMRMANAIPVEKKATNRTALLIDAARERTKRGIRILAFPEGHRTVDGQLRPFRRGVFFMAREAGLPIVPVAVRGAYKVFPKGTWMVSPGHIDVWIGPPMETKGLSDDEIGQLAERTRATITRWAQGDSDPLGDGATAKPEKARPEVIAQ